MVLLGEAPSVLQVAGVAVILIGISMARLGHEHDEDPVVVVADEPEKLSEGLRGYARSD